MNDTLEPLTVHELRLLTFNPEGFVRRAHLKELTAEDRLRISRGEVTREDLAPKYLGRRESA